MPHPCRAASVLRVRAWSLPVLVIPMGVVLLLAAHPAASQNLPVAVDDSYAWTVNATLSVAAPGVLANDTDADGDSLSVYSVNGATGNVGAPITLGSGATLTVNALGSFTYTPDPGFVGSDSFTYRVSDEDGPSVLAATVTITLEGIGAIKTGCVDESNNDTNNCTANDLTFVQLGLGEQRDGCVNSTDRVKIFLRGAVQNTTAQARYDVGLWFPRPSEIPPNVGIIDPEGDGALSGECYLAGLMNPEPPPPTDACTYDSIPGALDLESGSGPWVNADGTGDYDSCGDVYANASSTECDLYPFDGRWDDSIIKIDLDPQGIEIDCTDDDGTGVLDGFVNMPVCLTWGNQKGQVDNDGNGLCDAMSELQPGTKSKCRCEQYQPTDIPAPELQFSCPDGPTRAGSVVTMQFTYTNACSCTPNPLTPERFRCCTASYIEFVLGFDPAEGAVATATPGAALGAASFDNLAGTITWRPGFSSSGDGIIPQSGTDTLTVQFTLTGSTLSPFSVTTNWADAILSGQLVNPVSQTSLSGSCSINLNSTWANVTGLAADVRRGRTVVSWETSAEVGSVGYDVYRRDADGSGWIKVNEALVPALGDGPGGRYELVDELAPIEGAVTYKVHEVDLRGREVRTRPRTIVLRENADAQAPADDLRSEPRRPSPRLRQAVSASARAAAKSGALHRAPAGGRLAPRPPETVKIGVAETGLHRVSAQAVAAALGEPPSKIAARIAQHNLALTTGGQPVAWQAEPDAGGILFYGQAPTSRHDAERPYLLRAGRGLAIEAAGEAPSQVDAEARSFRDTVRFEQDLLLRPFNVFDADADYWFWDVVIAGNPQYRERSVDIELTALAAPSGPARLDVAFLAFGAGLDASGSMYVNDHFIGTLAGPVPERREAAFAFDQSVLRNGANTLRIIGHQGGLFIDRVDLSYERGLSASGGELTVRSPRDEQVAVQGFITGDVRAFDITDPLRPTELPLATASYPGMIGVTVGFERTREDGTYLVVADAAVRSPASILGRPQADLVDGTPGADYLVITTRELAEEAERLAEHRRSDGLQALVVDVEDIFDEFAFGSRDPGAITAYLRAAAESWSTPPRYVLLAGRGHYDPRDLMGYGGNLLPPVLAVTGDGLVPSDSTLADLDGDALPDLAVGRIPAVTAAELRAAIDKIIAYEAAADGPWSKRVMLAADDPDEAGDFYASAEVLGRAVPAGRSIETVRLFEPHDAGEVNAWLVGALNDGAGLVNWVGHAGLDSLANERVLTIPDLEDLESTAHPSLVVGLTCIVNNFGFPYFATLGEELAMRPRGGAIAVWAASGLSDNAYAEALGEAFLAALDGPGSTRLGDVILRASDAYAVSHPDRGLVNEYVLLGDPAVQLK